MAQMDPPPSSRATDFQRRADPEDCRVPEAC